MRERLLWTTVAVAGIWLAVLVISLFALDLVSGSEQEHLPLPAFTAWIWGAIATWLALNAVARPSANRSVWIGVAATTVIIWAVVAMVSVFSPMMITGTDPTRLPLAALVAPIGGAIVTGIASSYVRLFVEMPVGD